MPHSWSREQTDVFNLFMLKVLLYMLPVPPTHRHLQLYLSLFLVYFPKLFWLQTITLLPVQSTKQSVFLWEKAALVLGSMPQSSVDAAQQPVCLVRPPVLCNFAEDWEMLCFRFVMARWCCSTSAPLHMAQQWPLTSQLRRNRRRRMVGAGV